MQPRRVVALAVGAMSAVLLLLITWKLRGPVVLLALAVAVAAAAEVGIQALQARGLRRGVALAVTYGSALLMLSGLVGAISGPLLPELHAGAESLVRGYERFSARLPDGGTISRMLATYLPSPRQMAAAITNSNPTAIASDALDTSGWVLGRMSALLIILILALHWSASRERLGRFALCSLPADRRSWARQVYADMEAAVGRQLAGGLIKGYLALVVLAVGFRLSGVPFPTVLAVVAAALAVVPLLGVLLGPALVLTVTWSHAPGLAVVAALATAALVLVLDRVVSPRLVQTRRPNPVLEIVVLLVLARAVGPLGLLAAPAVAAILHIGARRLALRRTRPETRSIEEIRRRLAELRQATELPPELASVTDSLEAIAVEAEQLDDEPETVPGTELSPRAAAG